ncbi:FAD-binding domain-containing protein [Eremomyces bilateralis CBS 781.70]|uniref:FAD-binding domain-containing protein n=1 Tax=Eremomyces bilateralis CBS 781.70 TaxID=1392243 RepID=A0A6G1FWH1_9PEZI|nr:FAD-binding domain-containing protein [Eremomyces bilateralis CBS 781.70]KAF1810030.1 FAD-binding domain-containing protein [Eremomyces bilateralis CBS 781.70]
MKGVTSLLSFVLYAGLCIADPAPMPPIPDKVLTPNSSNAPAGCKLLASDAGFPSNETVKAALPNAIFKQWGTKGPDWVVQAKTVQDVQAGVNFSAQHNVRLTVITKGHDFMARADARSGLRIDMSQFNENTVFATSWKCGDVLTPGASVNKITPVPGEQAVARVSASMYHEKFYEEASQSGLFTMGAQHGGVSTIGGWAQGGGHNPFSREYGMMVDQILEFEVVTADGKFQKVSECNNPELFWALRGGGGSTFGVVTAATVKVYPTIPIGVARFFVNSTTPKLWDAVAYFLQQGPTVRDQYGAQGYFYVYHNAFESVLHFPAQYATEANMKAGFEPLKAKMDELAGATAQPIKYYTYKTYKDWYAAEQGNHDMEHSGTKWLSWYDGSDGSAPGQAEAMENPLKIIPWAIKNPQTPAKRSIWPRYHAKRDEVVPGKAMRPMSRTYLDSRLLTAQHVRSVSQDQLAKIMNNTLPGITNNHIRGFLLGGNIQAKPAANAMGLNPAWRTMTYHIIVNAVPGDIRHDYDVSAMKTAFPTAGAYLNEASPDSPDWKRAYFGSNYARLEQLKKKYDPKNVLWCSPCVGADFLSYDDERICPARVTIGQRPPPSTLPNKDSLTGIASLPSVPGIANPLMPYIQQYLTNGVIPDPIPDFSGGSGGHHGEEEGEMPGGHDHGAPVETTSAAGGHDHGAPVATTAVLPPTTTAAGEHGHEDTSGDHAHG